MEDYVSGESRLSTSSNSSFNSQQDEVSAVRPPFSAFICPISKKIMRDPVVIENGNTFERDALVRLFEDCTRRGRRIVCPITLMEISSTNVVPNTALRSCIEEWRDINDAIRLDRAGNFLNNESEEIDSLWALGFITHFCKKNQINKVAVRKKGMIPMIASMLSNRNDRVRPKVLEELRILVEENDENKRVLAEGNAVRTTVKFLSQGSLQEMELAVSLLFELSKSELLCEKIGRVDGAIIILAGIATDQQSDYSAEKAEIILENLGKCEENIMRMAEVGRLEPLLDMLLYGTQDKQQLMASHLKRLVLSNELKLLVANKAGPSLVNLLINGTNETQESSLKALCPISSNLESATILIRSGILQPLISHLFSVGPNHLAGHRMKMKELASACLSNLVSTGIDFTNVRINEEYQSLVCEKLVQDLLHLVSNTGPAIQYKLLQVLTLLTDFDWAVLPIVKAIKTMGALTTLIQFVEAQRVEIHEMSLKLLKNISPYMDQELAETLVRSPGQLGSLIKEISDGDSITGEQMAVIGLLASLPKRDLNLTTQLMEQDAFDVIVSKVLRIRRGDISSNRYTASALEGFAKILSSITFVLENNRQNINLAVELDLALVFTDLLGVNGNDGVVISSAIGLGNLSRESRNLSVPPPIPPSPSRSGFKMFSRKQKSYILPKICRVHQGTCSAKSTFCLIECNAIEKLIICLDNKNKKISEHSLDALCTLLEDRVDTVEGVTIINEFGGITRIFDVMIHNENTSLQKKAIWAVERILRVEEMARQVSSGHPSVGIALGRAFQRGDSSTRDLARKSLEHIRRIPIFSEIYTR
ncbi:hypothetical protein LUZ60_011976 [Juncus effusus]|nr:hypothetical protein LUZ60_011976 [Juncus effusus]